MQNPLLNEKRFTLYSAVKEMESPRRLDLSEIIDFVKKGVVDIDGAEINLKDSLYKIRQMTHEAVVFDKKEMLKSVKEKVNPAKLSLPGFVPGVVNGRREDSNLIEHSGFIVLDCDLEDNWDEFKQENKLYSIKRYLMRDDQIAFAFLSPSNYGLKIGVAIDPATPENHNKIYEAVGDYLKTAHKLVIDPSCKNVSRLCFLSYDPEVYYNPTARPFSIGQRTVPNPLQQAVNAPTISQLVKEVSDDTQDRFDFCLKSIEASKVDITRSYDTWLKLGFSIAATFGEAGREYYHRISKFHSSYTKDKCDGQFSNCLKSDKGGISIGTFFHICKESGIVPPAKENNNISTPNFPSEVISNLPSIFRDFCNLYPAPDIRDMGLLCLLVFFSMVLWDVFVIHGKRKYRPNLYAVIVAHAGHGKGVLNDARIILKHVQGYFDSHFEEDKKEYYLKLKEYKQDQADGVETEKPEPPFRKTIVLPMDLSAAALLRKLENNNGWGILTDTEAGDTMGATKNQDWAKMITSIIKKGYQQEPISASRKDKDIEILNSYLGMLGSMTPGKVADFFPDPEEGTFSRVLINITMKPAEWDDSVFSPDGWEIKEEKLDTIALKVNRIFKYMIGRNRELIMIWKRSQVNILNEQFKKWLKQNHAVFGHSSSGIIFRLGLMTSRIAAILTIARRFDGLAEKDLPFDQNPNPLDDFDTFHCEDQDLNIALKIIEIALFHSYAVFEGLQRPEEKDKSSGKKAKTMEFFNLLPTSFQRKDINQIIEKLGISVRTADSYLQQLSSSNPSLLKRGTKGEYEKC